MGAETKYFFKYFSEIKIVEDFSGNFLLQSGKSDPLVRDRFSIKILQNTRQTKCKSFENVINKEKLISTQVAETSENHNLSIF